MRDVLLAFCLFFVLIHAPALGQFINDPSAEEAHAGLDGTIATYSGKLSEDNVRRFLDMVNGNKVEVLVVSSSGGEIHAGMQFGEWIFDNKIDVVVKEMCMSSCANYVFTAGRRKTIEDNAIVGWHGNILQTDGTSEADVRAAVIAAFDQLDESVKTNLDLEVLIEQSIRQMSDYRMKNMAVQTRFFEKIGVDEHICRVGNEEYGAEDFFLLSVEDMARFGVLDVHAPEGYEQIDLEPYRRMGKRIEFIRLER